MQRNRINPLPESTDGHGKHRVELRVSAKAFREFDRWLSDELVKLMERWPHLAAPISMQQTNRPEQLPDQQIPKLGYHTLQQNKEGQK